MPASRPQPADERTRIVVVGSGWRFLSGISYYTCRLSNALQERYDVGTVLMRALLPARLYPGRERVGQALNALDYDPRVRVFDGVDWWAVPSLFRAVRFVRSARPDVVVLQWWTGTVLHSYLALAVAARLSGAKVVIEFHEVQDTGEARHKIASAYVRRLIRPLLRRTDGVILHSKFDQELLHQSYALRGIPEEIAKHGPYDHHVADRSDRTPGSYRLLFFGTVRPYKGLEDLIEAFSALGPEYRLTVVGETWEGWTLPAELIAASPAADRIAFVNRYVADAEVDQFFADADMVVLPYRRSSASGPLHIAMSHGLPVVVTAVGGLVEAAGDYPGTTFAEEANPPALAEAIKAATTGIGTRYADPSSWEATVSAYARLIERMNATQASPQDAETATSSNQTVPSLSPDLR